MKHCSYRDLACPPFWLEDLSESRGGTIARISDRLDLGSTLLGSDQHRCPSAQGPSALKTAEDLSDFYARHLGVKPRVAPAQFLGSPACSSQADGLSPGMSDDEKRVQLSTFYLQMYRLKQRQKEAISAVASIDSLLGRLPLDGIRSCGDDRMPETQVLCDKLRSCPAQSDGRGLDRLAEATRSAIYDLAELQTLKKVLALGGGVRCVFPKIEAEEACKESDRRRWSGTRCVGKSSFKSGADCSRAGGTWVPGLPEAQSAAIDMAIQELSARYPWIEGSEFKKNHRGPDSVKGALQAQLEANRKEYERKMTEYRAASGCMTGSLHDERCKDDARETLAGLGQVASPPALDMTPAERMDANEYLNRASCQLASRRIKGEWRHQMGQLAVTEGLTLVGVGATHVGSILEFAGVAGEAASSRRLLTAVSLAANVGWASRSAESAYKACLSHPRGAIQDREGGNVQLGAEQCPEPDQYLSGQAQMDGQSCSLSVAFAALDLMPFLPHVFMAEQVGGDMSVIASIYTPIHVPKTVSSDALVQSTEKALQSLERRGVQVVPARGALPILSHDTETFGRDVKVVPLTKTGKRYFGGIFEVKKLPEKTGGRGAFSNALSHPDMPRYLQKMHDMGYKLMIDTTLEASGRFAYAWGAKGYMALGPNSNWAAFLHEFQHLEFDCYIESQFPRIEAGVAQGQRVADVMPPWYVQKLGASKIERLQALLDQGLPELAVNETLSSEVALQAMGFRRYMPLAGPHARRYALTYHVQGLEELKRSGVPLSAAQEQTLSRAKREIVALYGYSAVSTAAIAAGAYQAAKYMIAIPGSSRKYLELLYDQQGNMLGRTADGKWMYLKGSPR